MNFVFLHLYLLLG